MAQWLNIGCSSRGVRFNSKHPCGDSQPPVTSVQEIQCSLLVSTDTRHTSATQKYAQIHEIN